MKKTLLRVVLLATIYSFIGFVFQAFLVTTLLAFSNSNAQNLKDIHVNLSAENITLIETFNLIEQHTQFNLVYESEILDNKKVLSFDLNEESL